MEELVWIHVCLSPKPLSQLCFTAWIPLFKKNNFDVYILDEIIWEDILVRGYPGGAVVKNPPASTGDAGSSLGWVNPLEKEITTYSSILAWKILWTEEPGRLQSRGSQTVRHNLAQHSYKMRKSGHREWKKRRTRQREDHLSIQWEGSHLSGKEGSLRRKQTCQHLGLGLAASRNVRKYIFVM